MGISYFKKKSPVNWQFVKKWVIKCTLMFCSSHKDIVITAGVSRKGLSIWGESVTGNYLLQSSDRERKRYRWEVKTSVTIQSCSVLTVSNHRSCQDSLLLDGQLATPMKWQIPCDHLATWIILKQSYLSNNVKYFNALVPLSWLIGKS